MESYLAANGGIFASPTVLDRIRNAAMRSIELAAVVMIVVLNCIVLIAVFFRYVLHDPLIWTDEVQVLVFFWLSMLGTVLASELFQHVRMSVVADMLPPGIKSVVAAAVSIGEVLLFVALLLPALNHAFEEAIIRSPILEYSNFWKSAALPVCVGLIVANAILRLFSNFDFRKAGGVLAATLLCLAYVAIAYAFGQLLPDIGNYQLILFFGLLGGGAIILGFPIAYAFLASTYAYMIFCGGTPAIIPARMEAAMSHMLLLSIPAFVLLGYLLTITGMAKALIQFVAAIVGHIRGGLDYVLIIAMFLISGISGSKSADMAAVAPALFPEMKKLGGKPGEMVALLAATGVQTETIPPSLVLIAIGSVTTVSISQLFAGGLLPAVFMGFILAGVVFVRTRKSTPSLMRPTASQIGQYFVAALPALALPVIIRTAVVEGIATATEVATIGVFYALLYALVAKRSELRTTWRPIYRSLVDASVLSGAIMFIVGGVTPMAFALTQSGFSDGLVESVKTLPGGAASFMAASIVMFIVLGAILEGLPAMILFAPLMFPLAAQLQIDLVHYAVVVIFSMGMGLFMPPFGVGYYVACAISGVDSKVGLRPLSFYMLALLVGLVIVAAAPSVPTVFFPGRQ